MLLWFVGLSVAIVWLVFRSPAIDHRMVALGALLPVGEVLTGGPKVLHTLLGAVAILTVTMVATQRRRLVRRRWLGISVGLFLHLALDGVFTQAQLFWWPFLGWSLAEATLPETSRSLALVAVMELIGAAVCVWCYRAFDLATPARRDLMLRTGQVDRALLPPAAPSR